MRFFAATVFVVVAVYTNDNGGAKASDFSSYLTDEGQRPALIGYSPSCVDPRSSLPLEPALSSCISQDLESIRHAFNGLILYTYNDELTPLIVREAVQKAFRGVLLGIEDPKSEIEVNGIAHLIGEYHRRLAIAVVVGNEGLIENRYTMDDVAAAERRLRQLQPPSAVVRFTTSEPASDYGYAPLRSFGDFLAPNIHPAIDEPALDAAAAARWVRQRAEDLSLFARKPVLVKETGLPNGGATIFTPERQLAFWCAYLHEGRLRRLSRPQNLWVSYAAAFEAFDLNWKAEKTEIPLEGRWGLMDQDRRPYPAYAAWAEQCSPAPSSPPQGFRREDFTRYSNGVFSNCRYDSATLRSL